MEDLAKKCINDHRNPLVKIELPTQKHLFTPDEEQETESIKKFQCNLKAALSHERVEKRCKRARAIWNSTSNEFKVTKVVKNLLKFFGYQNEHGIFLLPEEMLFLLETNRLEVFHNNISITVEEAYRIVVNTPGLTKYRIYKKLAMLGYKVVRYEQLELKTRKTKRKAESKVDADKNKISKIESSQELDVPNNQNKKSEELKIISEIFEKIRKNMPKSCIGKNQDRPPDYCIWLPTNVGSVEPDFNIFVCTSNIMDRVHFDNNNPNIYATCLDDVAFFQITNVNTPFLD